MDHVKVLKRAWNILWSYRALWIFGIILALASFSPGGNGGGGSGAKSASDSGAFRLPLPQELQRALQQFNELLRAGPGQQTIQAIVSIVIVLGCLFLLLIVLSRIAYYVSEVALIRMVDDHETTGEKLTWRQGLRLGWSRPAWRLFLIDLVVFGLLFLAFTPALGLVAIPALLGVLRGIPLTLPQIVAIIGLVFLLVFLAILIGVLLSLVLPVARRVAVLRNTGVFAAIRLGMGLIRRSFKEIALMWLILLGIRIAYGILILPVVFLLIAVGLLFGGGIGAGLYFLALTTGNVAVPWILAGVVGAALFLLLLLPPLVFLHGLRETYFSTAWTLTYRELSPAVEQEQE